MNRTQIQSRESNQLQFGFKTRGGFSVVTNDTFRTVTPGDLMGTTLEQYADRFSRNAYCRWVDSAKKSRATVTYKTYIREFRRTLIEKQRDYNDQVSLSGTLGCPSLDRLKKNLRLGGDPNHQALWNDGAPALHQWALLAHVDAVKLLLNYGADINILDNLGRSALEYATGALNWSKPSKAEQVVKLIIQAGGDVNVKSTLGHTPLIWAARAGNLNITKLLIEKGANANDTDNDGNNALHYARNPGYNPASTVKRNRQATIRLLRKHRDKTAES
jgi:hypothetical protein